MAGSLILCRTMPCLTKSVTLNTAGVNASGYDNF